MSLAGFLLQKLDEKNAEREIVEILGATSEEVKTRAKTLTGGGSIYD